MVTVAGFSSPALLLPGDAPFAPGDALLVLVDATLIIGFLATSSLEDRECHLVAMVLFCTPDTPALSTDCLSAAALCKGNSKQALTHRQDQMMLQTQLGCELQRKCYKHMPADTTGLCRQIHTIGLMESTMKMQSLIIVYNGQKKRVVLHQFRPTLTAL